MPPTGAVGGLEGAGVEGLTPRIWNAVDGGTAFDCALAETAASTKSTVKQKHARAAMLLFPRRCLATAEQVERFMLSLPVPVAVPRGTFLLGQGFIRTAKAEHYARP